MAARILVADNFPDHLEHLADLITRMGHEVETASTPEQAMEKLRRGNYDLAIIDVRLRNDEDDHDTSGVEVAYAVAPTVPKILMTRFDEPAFLQRVLDHLAEGAFQDEPEAVPMLNVLLTSVFPREQHLEILSRVIRQALWVGQRIGGFRKEAREIIKELREDHRERRRQARWAFKLAILAGIVGTGLVVVALFLASGENASSSWSVLSGVGGVLLDACAGWLWKFSREANQRLDESSEQQLMRLLDRLLVLDLKRFEQNKRDDKHDGHDHNTRA